MAKAPAFQFYVRDWLTDTELGQCSPATRGIWMDLLANMWVAPERGEIKGSPDSLARVCRCTTAEMAAALVELDQTETASVTRNGKVTDRRANVTVRNRRMWREEQQRKSNAERQMRHRKRQKEECNGESHSEITRPSASASASAVKEPPFPPCLDTPEFRAKWAEWEQHRKEIRHALKPTTRKRQLTKLARWGAAQAIAAIDQSIEQGWQGLFEPRAGREPQYPPDHLLGDG